MKKIIIMITLLALNTYSESGRLVDQSSGNGSKFTVLTNGASFHIGDRVYVLELDQSADALLERKLRSNKIPLRVHKTGALHAFNLVSQVAGISIVCGEGVNSDLEVSLNTKDQTLYQTIELICLQIGAKMEIKDNSVLILPNKKVANQPLQPTVETPVESGKVQGTAAEL